ncbi:hypothetical protein GCM10022267_30380 [Lentzea roselyniae]|uniref:Uncharacterized protein n=1 Tax=Lentzea roselyniae TaxID=531940 RepID=A0ABP7AWY8_9PSEU
MQGRVRLPVQVTQGVPLHEGQPERGERLAQRAVVAVLQAFHGECDVSGAVLHDGDPNHVAYIRKLI